MKKHIELESGFKFTIDDAVLDDFDLVELIADCEDNPMLVTKIAKKIYGEKTLKALKDHLRTKDGRVPISAITNAIDETFTAMGDAAKN